MGEQQSMKMDSYYKDKDRDRLHCLSGVLYPCSVHITPTQRYPSAVMFSIIRSQMSKLSNLHPPKYTPWRPRRGWRKRPRTANRALGHRSQGVRHRAEGCMALRW
jgi:hypothetical protein